VCNMTVTASNFKKAKGGTKWTITPKLVNDTIKKVVSSDTKVVSVTNITKKSFVINVKKKKGKAQITIESRSGIVKKLTITNNKLK
ncbi:MAG: hypothetical protein K5886_01080, partial [Lachnospiraceae bacterium]|nr:hypothetical protein [Lachnospiraceae bacterium]